MAGSGSLHIRRHVVTYRCVDQDAGTLATGSLDEALDEGLTAHLDEALAAVGTFAAGGVWLIRRIDLSIAIGKTWSAQRIAGAMARWENNLQVAGVYSYGAPKIADEAFAHNYPVPLFRFENRTHAPTENGCFTSKSPTSFSSIAGPLWRIVRPFWPFLPLPQT